MAIAVSTGPRSPLGLREASDSSMAGAARLGGSRVLGMVVACAVVVAGCSSDGSDDSADTGGDAGLAVESDGAESSGATQPSEAEPDGVDAANVDCAELEQAVLAVRDTGAQMSVLEEQATLDLIFESTSVDDLQAQIEVLRQYQDVEGESFGSMRAGLDNLEADLAAYSEDRWDDRVGGYPLVEAVDVFNVLGCG
jgi:hypothetical protein